MQIGHVSHVNLYFESIDKGEKRMKRRMYHILIMCIFIFIL